MVPDKTKERKRQVLKNSLNPKHLYSLDVVLFTISIFIAYKIFWWLDLNIVGFPYGVGSVDLLVFVTFAAASIMILSLFVMIYRSKKAVLSVIIFLVMYSIIFGLTQVPGENGNYGFDFWLSFGLMSLVLIFGLFFTWESTKNPLISTAKGSPEISYVFFVTGILWLCPLIGETLLQQKSNGLVLGGYGFSDILFAPGFSVLAASLFYCSFRVVRKKIFPLNDT